VFTQPLLMLTKRVRTSRAGIGASSIIICLVIGMGCGSSHARKDNTVLTQQQTDWATDELRRAYAAFNRGDIDRALQLLDPNVKWIEQAEFPGGGAYQGVEGAKRYLMQSRAGAAEVISQPEKFIVAGDRIVVFVYARVLPKNSNTWQEIRLADVYTFQGAASPLCTPLQTERTRFAGWAFRRSNLPINAGAAAPSTTA
jgi:ketosteroid isomerase-like protein